MTTPIRAVTVSLLVALLPAFGGAAASAQSGGGQPGGGGPPGDDGRPTAAFTFSPSAPRVGETVTFTSTSQPSPGATITEFAWDLDGEGGFDDFDGSTASWSFSEPGTHVVRLRVRQDNGRPAVHAAEIVVAGPSPAPPPAPGAPPPPPGETALVMMSPFPTVRIAGMVLPRGAQVRILSVRAPRGARIRARCRGEGCPAASVARVSTTGLVRLRRFERRLRAGIRIGIFVRKSGTIGKYTRFLIRAGRPPARIDRCLIPGSSRPVPCV
jgi:plastocyanin